MPRRKPKPDKVVQEQIKASLDSILLDENLDITRRITQIEND